MTDAQTIDHDAMQALRLRMRRERQARVGILRNPNQPPRPPAHRASLTGRWMNLRSSRRLGQRPDPGPDPNPNPSRASDALAASEAPQPAVVLAEDGHVEKIDVAGLMASVDAMADNRPARTLFAAEFRADVQRAAAARDRPREGDSSILSRQAWIEEGPDPAETIATPRRRERAVILLARLILSGIGGAVVAALVLVGLFGVPR